MYWFWFSCHSNAGRRWYRPDGSRCLKAAQDLETTLCSMITSQGRAIICFHIEYHSGHFLLKALFFLSLAADGSFLATLIDKNYLVPSCLWITNTWSGQESFNWTTMCRKKGIRDLLYFPEFERTFSVKSYKIMEDWTSIDNMNVSRTWGLESDWY